MRRTPRSDTRRSLSAAALSNALRIRRGTTSTAFRPVTTPLGSFTFADSTSDSTFFARCYSRPPGWFLLLPLVICLSLRRYLLRSDATKLVARLLRRVGAPIVAAPGAHLRRRASNGD